MVFNAAWLLGKIGPKSVASVPILTKLLRSSDKDIRWHAA